MKPPGDREGWVILLKLLGFSTPPPFRVYVSSLYSCSKNTSAFPTFRMKHLAAYLLAVLAGNTSPSSDDLKGILESVGAEADSERIEFLLSEVNGKDITEVIGAGREKLASVPCGGGGVAVATPVATAAATAAAPAAAEAKKEEKVEEKEESDDDMGFSLFD